MIMGKIVEECLGYDIEKKARVIIDCWKDMRAHYDDPDIRLLLVSGDIQVVYDGTEDLTSLIQEMQRQQITPVIPPGSQNTDREALQDLIDNASEKQAAALWPFIQEMQEQEYIVSHVFLPSTPASYLVALQELIDQLTDEEAADLLSHIQAFLRRFRGQH